MTEIKKQKNTQSQSELRDGQNPELGELGVKTVSQNFYVWIQILVK